MPIENTRKGGWIGVLANLMTNDSELKTQYNTLYVTKECSQIYGEGLWNISSSSSKLRVEVLYEALLVQHKYRHINNAKYVWDMNNIK